VFLLRDDNNNNDMIIHGALEFHNETFDERKEVKIR
jgi:hypothetical protein